MLRTVTLPASPSKVSTAPTEDEVEHLRQVFSRALLWASKRAITVNRKAAMTDEWTDFVLDWWAGVGRASDLTVDAHPTGVVDWAESWKVRRPKTMQPRGAIHEWMLDLALTTYPRYGGDYYSKVNSDALLATNQGELVIALESEWGSAGSARLNRGKVFEDALKLVHVRARLKVLCFGVTKAAGTDALVAELEDLRAHGGDAATAWLLFPVPWDKHPDDGILLKAKPPATAPHDGGAAKTPERHALTRKAGHPRT